MRDKAAPVFDGPLNPLKLADLMKLFGKKSEILLTKET